MTTLIKIENLSFAYSPKSMILSNINISIDQGEWVAIQGPSGSGKSTLLYLIGGLLSVQQGSIEIAGKNIATYSDLELAYFRNRNMGFVFQQFHLLPKTTLLQNILMPTIYPCELTSPSRRKREVQQKRGIALAERLGIGGPLLQQHP
ncbi:MAG: ATP-binding cassette domain-containing protein, partial [Oligoflexia bacterium]|nr:ATP-binding cassette domain-containing protein [Oligoflexia bacterium]